MPKIAAIAPPTPGVGPRLAAVAGFLAVAGLPLYLHLPRLAAEIGLPLSTVGLLLLGIRVLDFAQDPLLGWVAERYRSSRPALAAGAIAVVGAGLFMVFTVQPGLAGMAIALALVFTAYSLGAILFYAQCTEIAGSADRAGHFRIAGWRETGGLVGIVLAALIPPTVAAYFDARAGFAALGLTVAVAAPIIWRTSSSIWATGAGRPGTFDWRPMWRPRVRALLLIALTNALPVAVTSTLFVFFVEDRLQLPHLTGVYLLLFFVAAGAGAPVWSSLAARYGARRVLVPAMLAAVAAFAWTAWLPQGAELAFGIIAVATGASLGADMVILPALFSATLAAERLSPALGFGIWNFAAKLALALAAGTTLPLLDWAGYQPGGPSPPEALSALNAGYAVIPLILKLPALYLVLRLTREIER